MTSAPLPRERPARSPGTPGLRPGLVVFLAFTTLFLAATHQSFVNGAKAHLYHPALDCASLTTSRATSSADRKSTRLNSSHVRISYAVFCLKKKKKKLML